MAADKRDTRINDEVTAPEVRLVGPDGEMVGVVPIAKALAFAEEKGLDLVEVAPQAAPPVCRVMDYGKFLFEESKKRQAARKKQKQIQVKEVKFRPGTEEADYQVKLRKLIGFLEHGDKAKVSLRFRGREMAHQSLGAKLLKRIEGDLENYAAVEQYPRLEGRVMVMVLAPKKATHPAPAQAAGRGEKRPHASS
ncbi:MAG TPA: translation initiation factor IF-3 [Gammaproteobacteria bacterium]|nr:translation initiation factor IF-3 [Gammaproteobacteria bacterium]